MAAASSYTSTDKNPAPGKNYYRLKMTDKDGNYEYSKIITINTTTATSTSISLYPNPAKNYIVVNHPYAGNNEQVQIMNLQGNVLVQKKITTASFQTRIDLPELPKGVYAMVWTNGKATTGNSLVIQ